MNILQVWTCSCSFLFDSSLGINNKKKRFECSNSFSLILCVFLYFQLAFQFVVWLKTKQIKTQTTKKLIPDSFLRARLMQLID